MTNFEKFIQSVLQLSDVVELDNIIYEKTEKTTEDFEIISLPIYHNGFKYVEVEVNHMQEGNFPVIAVFEQLENDPTVTDVHYGKRTFTIMADNEKGKYTQYQLIYDSEYIG